MFCFIFLLFLFYKQFLFYPRVVVFILFTFSFFFVLTFFSYIYDFEHAMVCHSDFPSVLKDFFPSCWNGCQLTTLSSQSLFKLPQRLFHLAKGHVAKVMCFPGATHIQSLLNNGTQSLRALPPKPLRVYPSFKTPCIVSCVLLVTVSQPHFSLYPVLLPSPTPQRFIPRALLIKLLHDTLPQGRLHGKPTLQHVIIGFPIFKNETKVCALVVLQSVW